MKRRDIFAMEVFTRIVDLGTLTAAADYFNVSKSVISQQLADLEESLGVKLLNRSTRRLAVTDAGKGFYERSVHILSLVNEAMEEAKEQSAELSGTIAITAPHVLMEYFVIPAIAELTLKHPKLKPELIADDLRVDLLSKKLDFSLTLGRLPDSGYRAVPVGVMEEVLCCTPSYLKAAQITQDAPATVLQEKDYIANLWEGVAPQRLFNHPTEGESLLRFSPTRRANTVPLLKALTLESLGIACLPLIAIESELKEGRLVRLMPEHEPICSSFSAVHCYPGMMPRKVRVCIDHLKAWRP